MSGIIDPLARAQSFAAREGGAEGDRAARANMAALEGRMADERSALLSRLSQSSIEVVDFLPPIAEEYLGRMFYVRNDAETDVIVIGVSAYDGTLVWQYLDFPSQTGDLLHLRQDIDGGLPGFDTTPAIPVAMNVSSGGDRVYVINGAFLYIYNMAGGQIAYLAINGVTGLASGGAGGLAATKAFGTAAATIFFTVPSTNSVYRMTINAAENAISSGPTLVTSGLSGPTAVAVTAFPTYLVADTGNNRIVAYNSTGAQLWTLASGVGGAAFNAPQGLSIAQGTGGASLWVADTGNHQIVRFDAPSPSSAPAVFGAYGSYGAGYSQFVEPKGMLAVNNTPAVRTTLSDYQHFIAVSDTGNHRVQIINGNDGQFITRFGSYGNSKGEMRFPTTVARSTASRGFFVLDSGNRRLQEWVGSVEGVEVSVGGTVAGDTERINFVAGAGISVAATADTTNAEVDVTVKIAPTITQRSAGPYTIGAGGNTGLLTLACQTNEVSIAGGWQAGGEQRISAPYSYRAANGKDWNMMLYNGGGAAVANNFMYVICLAV